LQKLKENPSGISQERFSLDPVNQKNIEVPKTINPKQELQNQKELKKSSIDFNCQKNFSDDALETKLDSKQNDNKGDDSFLSGSVENMIQKNSQNTKSFSKIFGSDEIETPKSRSNNSMSSKYKMS